MEKQENLKMNVQTELRSVQTFHGTDYYIEVKLGVLSFSHLVPAHQEEEVKRKYQRAQITTLGEISDEEIAANR